MPTISLDFARINEKFQQGVPEFKAKLDAKKAKELHPEVANALNKAAAGFMGIPGTEGFDSKVVTVCAAWPKIRGMLNFGLKIAAWYPGYKNEIAWAKSFLAMLDTEFVPQVCAAEAPK